ncbi:MAG: trypsin-like peptidase domain-containing protein, partial [Chloroflexus sp.]|nr:trypsin-like peptidase domain-containing protein [Chloroflexus sp.]
KSAYIITNAHVVQGAAIVTVALTDDRQPRPARVIGLSACDDLAILKVDVIDGLRPATFSTTPPRIGEPVMAFGYPLDHLLGGSMSVTQGVISKLHMSFPDLPYVELIQTDTAINPGNSGGPLVNRNGHVVGITSLGLWPGFADGINFAIPVYSSAELIATLQGGKRYQWLGMITFDSDRYG